MGVVVDGIIGVKDAAEITHLSVQAIRALCERGKISGAVKVGRSWVIPRAWAEERRAEDYSATHMLLSEAAARAKITRAGMLEKVKTGEVKGFAQPLLERNRWWVERDAFEAWLGEREVKRRESTARQLRQPGPRPRA